MHLPAARPDHSHLPLHLQGTFSIRQLVAGWEADTPEPMVLLDVGARRDQYRREAEQWWLAWRAVQLSQHPSAHWHLPHLPRLSISVTDRSVSAPFVSIPSVSVSIPDVPTLPAIPRHIVHAFLTAAGKLSLGAGIASLLLVAGPIVILEGQSVYRRMTNHVADTAIYSASPSPLPTVTPTSEPYVSSDEQVFSVSVPELDIFSVVVPNVDAGDPEAYTQALKRGVAHAKGTGLPGQLENNKTIYLFAHSTDAPWNITRYNAQFYALKDAEPGQVIDVTFWGETTQYQIVEKKTVEPDDTSYLQPQTETEQLILQTCFPPGTVWKRLIVRAEKV